MKHRCNLKRITCLTVIALSVIIQPSNGQVSDEELEQYLLLNDSEQQLSEYKDSKEAISLKLSQLAIINKSRKKHKAQPVKLDILASRVANKMCRESAENAYISHWNMNGEKPYHRYAFAGGYDHVSENVYGEWNTGGYSGTPETIHDLMKKGHGTFMAERSPNDGHKKNIIDKPHNFVGIGYYLSGNQFRYNEEFINRYLEFENIPSSLEINEQGSITIKTNGEYFPYYLIVYREDIPTKMTVKQLNKTGSYPDYSKEEFLILPAWELYKCKKDDRYVVPLKINKEGYYYIHVFIDKKEIKQPESFSTKGKTMAAGIIIKVVK